MSEPLFDVIAVNIKTGAERFIDEAKTLRNAEAIEKIVIFRRGVEEEFYKIEPHPHTLAKSRTEDEGTSADRPSPVTSEQSDKIKSPLPHQGGG
jgi:hypothetical protein